MAELVREGKIRYVGLSNEHPWGVMEFLRHARELGQQLTLAICNVPESAIAEGLTQLSAGRSVILHTALGPATDRGAEIAAKGASRHMIGKALGGILSGLVESTPARPPARRKKSAGSMKASATTPPTAFSTSASRKPRRWSLSRSPCASARK